MSEIRPRVPRFRSWKYGMTADNFGDLKAIRKEMERTRRAPSPAVDALVEACRGLLTMMDRGPQPRKLDEALTWRENDERARNEAKAALDAVEAEREGRDEPNPR